MAATDVTYLFFQRDTGTADNGPLSPVIKTTRVVQHPVAGTSGRVRSGSVPPRPLRAGSQPPGTRSGSVTPSGRAGSAVPHHAGPGGIIKHRAATTTVVRGVRGDGTTGVVSGPPRSSHAVQRRRASISVVPGTAAAAAGAAAARRTTDQHQPIFRAEAFLKSVASDKHTTDGIKPSLTASMTRHMTSPLPPPPPTAAAEPGFRRRSSVSVSVAGPGDRRQRTTTVSRSLSSSLPLPTSPPVHYHHHLPAADTAAEVDVKSHVSRYDLPTEATIQAIFDKQLSKASLRELRDRANVARDRLSRHRVMIDRYLPTYMFMSPPGDVQDIVEYKVSELFDRMPQLDPNRSRYADTEEREVRASPITPVAVAPYQPLKSTVKVELPPLHSTTTFFTPKISDVRKRARSVLCKVKGDPNYFNL